jgi:hypothetical protein
MSGLEGEIGLSSDFRLAPLSPRRGFFYIVEHIKIISNKELQTVEKWLSLWRS